MRNFISSGDIVTIPAPAAVSSGDGVLVGTLFGIAATDAESGTNVPIKTTGVFTLHKTSAQAWTVGALIYWDAGNKVATTDDDEGASALIGKALTIAANPSGTGVVRLNG
jgi:predicted RecA/RadA family phage recombinase